MNNTTKALLISASATSALILTPAISHGAELNSLFTNIGSIANTRHNLTQSTTSIATNMDTSRNDYGEICVYCHTPHGANSQTNAPLWNRTISNAAVDGTYTTYDSLGTTTITASITQPGTASITCLSCHDGTVAIDSIINMPGSGLYDVNQETGTGIDAFLDGWNNPAGRQDTNNHAALSETGCLVCHNSNEFGFADNFEIYKIGTDLTNDHPIGINIPTGRFGNDFWEPSDTVSDASWSVTFYDTNNNDRADKEEIRFYNDRVECASCHDPHGVIPVGGNPSTTEFNPTFLRISNDASAVCLTCHDK